MLLKYHVLQQQPIPQSCMPPRKSQMVTVSLGAVSVSSEYPMFREWLESAVSVLVDLESGSDRAWALPGFSVGDWWMLSTSFMSAG